MPMRSELRAGECFLAPSGNRIAVYPTMPTDLPPGWFWSYYGLLGRPLDEPDHPVQLLEHYSTHPEGKKRLLAPVVAQLGHDEHYVYVRGEGWTRRAGTPPPPSAERPRYSNIFAGIATAAPAHEQYRQRYTWADMQPMAQIPREPRYLDRAEREAIERARAVRDWGSPRIGVVQMSPDQLHAAETPQYHVPAQPDPHMHERIERLRRDIAAGLDEQVRDHQPMVVTPDEVSVSALAAEPFDVETHAIDTEAAPVESLGADWYGAAESIRGRIGRARPPRRRGR